MKSVQNRTRWLDLMIIYYADYSLSLLLLTDNPSYFTVTGGNSGNTISETGGGGGGGGGGTKSKRFKNWFKMKRPFRSKNVSEDSSGAPEEPSLPQSPSSDCNDLGNVVYYNFSALRSAEDAPDAGEDAPDAEDDVFSDTSTVRQNGWAENPETISRVCKWCQRRRKKSCPV